MKRIGISKRCSALGKPLDDTSDYNMVKNYVRQDENELALTHQNYTKQTLQGAQWATHWYQAEVDKDFRGNVTPLTKIIV